MGGALETFRKALQLVNQCDERWGLALTWHALVAGRLPTERNAPRQSLTFGFDSTRVWTMRLFAA